MVYAGFWKRFAAYWLDLIVLLPIIAFTFWGNEQARLFQFYYFVPGLLIGLWFHVYLVRRYGGTPGKLIMKIKIVRVDGSDVGYIEAALRYSVLFVLSVISAVPLMFAAMSMTDAEYLSLDWQARMERMVELAPSWYNMSTLLMNVWVWSEFVVMLTNKKRRAIHDFIAGTVVIHSTAPNQSMQTDQPSAGR